MQVIRNSDFASTPWKNGGGVTREAIRVPAVGDPFQWRVSVAEIDRSGPFSDFVGYQRKMALLRGHGIELSFHDGVSTLLRRAGDWVSFEGAATTHCELINGPCTDLNLMVRNGLDVQVYVHRLHASLEPVVAPGSTLLIFPIDGPLVMTEGSVVAAELGTWDLAIVSRGGYRLAQPSNSSAPTAVFLATIGI